MGKHVQQLTREIPRLDHGLQPLPAATESHEAMNRTLLGVE